MEVFLPKLEHPDLKKLKEIVPHDHPFIFEYKDVLNYIEKLQSENEQLKAKIKSLTSTSTSKKLYGEYKHVRLTDKELQTLIETYGKDLTKQLITYLDEYIEMKGYKAKNHYLCIYC